MKPSKTIRRFDVFAEYRKQEQLEKGESEAVARGYGLWVAKVVASRRSGSKGSAGDTGASGKEGADGKRGPQRQGQWHLLDGEPQTAALFEREIVQRMGQGFYDEIFVPAIHQARQEGKSYEQIRDALRKGWNT